MRVSFLFAAICTMVMMTATAYCQRTENQYPKDITKERALPEGVKLELITDYDSPIEGFSKVRILRFTLPPNSRIKNYKTVANHFCYALSGEMEVTKADRSKVVVKAGDSMIEPKGRVYPLLENKGNTPYVEVIFELTESQTSP